MKLKINYNFKKQIAGYSSNNNSISKNTKENKINTIFFENKYLKLVVPGNKLDSFLQNFNYDDDKNIEKKKNFINTDKNYLIQITEKPVSLYDTLHNTFDYDKIDLKKYDGNDYKKNELLKSLNFGDILIKKDEYYVINNLYIFDEDGEKRKVIKGVRYYLKPGIRRGQYQSAEINDTQLTYVYIDFMDNYKLKDNAKKLSNVFANFDTLLRKKTEGNYIKKKIDDVNLDTLKIGDKLHTELENEYMIFYVDSNGVTIDYFDFDYYGNLITNYSGYQNKSNLKNTFTHVSVLQK